MGGNVGGRGREGRWEGGEGGGRMGGGLLGKEHHTSNRFINFFFKALFAAASVARRMSDAACRNRCCSLASFGFLAAP